MVHFNVPRDWFEINLRHEKRYSEDGKKFRRCHGLLERVISILPQRLFSLFDPHPRPGAHYWCTQLKITHNLALVNLFKIRSR